MLKKLKSNWHLILLGAILIIGLVFRTYQIVQRYDFGLDQDLQGWIVKDIVVDHHLRLIGQLTSAKGIYVGPIFYYSLIPFYLLTHMDPIGGLIPVTILGMLTLISYYYVFNRLFNKYIALIITLIQAVSIPIVILDRWVVPSTPTNLWQVWFFFAVVMLARGNLTTLPLLAVLISLIWNIHIALIPALLAVPAAFLVSKKLPTLKQTITFFAVLIITSAPLILFELKHNFLQTVSFFKDFTSNNISANENYVSGFQKILVVVEKFGSSIALLYINSLDMKYVVGPLIVLLLLLLTVLLTYRKILKFRDLIPLYAWILGVVGFYMVSSIPVSEYYFFNTYIIFSFFLSAALYWILKTGQLGKYLVILALGAFLIYNSYTFINSYYFQKGYLARKNVALFITQDAKAKGYPCVAVSYITSPGEAVGFRTFFWLDHQHVNLPKNGGPIYNIIVPDSEVDYSSLNYVYGHIGVQVPKQVPSFQDMQKSCSIPDPNLTESMLGFTTN